MIPSRVTDPPLVLASTSPYRRELLERLRLPFTCAPPKVDEALRPGELPRPRAERLALAKAQAVARTHTAHVIIGADQVCALEGLILDKPGDAAAALVQLRAQSGRAVRFFSAVAVLHAERRQVEQFVDVTTVQFRALSEAEIEAYVRLDAPFDCAGALRSEALGLSLCERVESEDPTGLVGLPLIRLAASLRALGYALP